MFITLCGGVTLAVVIGVVLTSLRGNLSDEQKRARINKLYEGYRRKFPSVEEITVGELLAACEKGSVVIVDVRDPTEQEVSMIPGAIRVSQFEQEAEKHKSSTIVAYCTVGSRSGLYAKKLEEKGYSVSNLKGGILSWVHAGQNVANNDGPVQCVHVYGPRWNLLPEGHVAVW